MALSFQPKSEDELKSGNLLEQNTYDFEVLSAEHAVSKKSGNPMIKLKLGVFRQDGTQAWVYDYLIGTMESKLRHFCDTCGLLPKYQAGTLAPEDCEGRSGKVKIAIEPASESFPAKNVAKDYVCRPAKPIAPVQSASTDDDDIPPF